MTSPETSKLKQVLDKISRDVEKLKAGTAAPQLANSSIEVTQGRGYIPIMENGVEKHRIGRQPDGTITSVSVNNLVAPIVPNRPICTPFFNGVTVSCDGFQAGSQYLDFSHINIYVDGQIVGTLMKVPEAFAVTPLDPVPHSFALTSVNLSGTESAQSPAVIATPNLVVGSDITNGIIDTLKLKDDAVTAAKIAAAAVGTTEIADDSISTQKVIAQAIQAAQIAVGAVLTDKIAAGAITSDKIVANAVTALQIAANAVTAGAIQAGSVTASKLEATMILANKIIAGSPTGKRLQLDYSGLFQTDNNGNLSLQFGNNGGAGNTLTVIDKNDPSNALATIGSDGSGSFTGMSTNGSFTVNGVDLIQFLNNTPSGARAYGIFLSLTPSTTGEIGFYELSCDLIAGRQYRVTTSPIFIIGDLGSLRVRYTIDGSTPTVNSQLLQEATGSSANRALNGNAVTDGGNAPYDQSTSAAPSAPGGVDNHTHVIGGHNHYMSHQHNAPYQWNWPTIPAQLNSIVPAGSNMRLRLLFSIFSSTGNSVYGSFSGVLGFQMIVEDVGLVVSSTGGNNSGGGSSSASGNYTKTYNALWSHSFSTGDPAGVYYNGDTLAQGYDGQNHWMTMLGFDYNAIETDTSGATINKVEMFLYSSYWALSTGGLAVVGFHNDRVTGGATNYSFVGRDITEQHMNKPQGLWFTVANNIGTQLSVGSVSGIVLDSRGASNGDATGVNYGEFRSVNYIDSTVRPALRITYTK